MWKSCLKKFFLGLVSFIHDSHASDCLQDVSISNPTNADIVRHNIAFVQLCNTTSHPILKTDGLIYADSENYLQTHTGGKLPSNNIPSFNQAAASISNDITQAEGKTLQGQPHGGFSDKKHSQTEDEDLPTLKPEILQLFTLGHSNQEILNMQSNIFHLDKENLHEIMLTMSEAKILQRYIQSEKLGISRMTCKSCMKISSKCFNCKLENSQTSILDRKILETLARNIRLKFNADTGKYQVHSTACLPKDYTETFAPHKQVESRRKSLL